VTLRGTCFDDTNVIEQTNAWKQNSRLSSEADAYMFDIADMWFLG